MKSADIESIGKPLLVLNRLLIVVIEETDSGIAVKKLVQPLCLLRVIPLRIMGFLLKHICSHDIRILIVVDIVIHGIVEADFGILNHVNHLCIALVRLLHNTLP